MIHAITAQVVRRLAVLDRIRYPAESIDRLVGLRQGATSFEYFPGRIEFRPVMRLRCVSKQNNDRSW